MPELSADAALVGPAQPPMVKPGPPGVWDFPDEPVSDVPLPSMPEPEPEPEQDDMKPREFDARAKEPFRGLLWLGHLDKDVMHYGHVFSLSTPSGTERLQIGQVIADWSGTLTEEIAFARATVAAFLVKVDNEPLPTPVLNNPKETALHDRFVWVGENIVTQTLVMQLFQDCLLLDHEVDIALEAMEKA